MIETWNPIPGHKNYEASSVGRVRSLRFNGRILKGGINGKDYRTVALMVNGKAKTFYVHALVALAFRGPLPPNMEVRHYNGDKLNNSMWNVIYGTQLENIADNIRLGKTKNRLTWSKNDGDNGTDL